MDRIDSIGSITVMAIATTTLALTKAIKNQLTSNYSKFTIIAPL